MQKYSSKTIIVNTLRSNLTLKPYQEKRLFPSATFCPINIFNLQNFHSAFWYVTYQHNIPVLFTNGTEKQDFWLMFFCKDYLRRLLWGGGVALVGILGTGGVRSVLRFGHRNCVYHRLRVVLVSRWDVRSCTQLHRTHLCRQLETMKCVNSVFILENYCVFFDNENTEGVKNVK